MKFKFKDSGFREWGIEITLGAVERVAVDTGVLLTDIVGDNQTNESEGVLFEKLMMDELLLAKVIYSLVKDQHQTIDLDSFYDAMDGEAFGNAEDAFWKAVIDFFRLRGRDYAVKILNSREQMLKTMSQAVDLEIKKAMEEITTSSATELPES